MFTPASTTLGAQITPSPYAPRSLPSIAQTTLIHAIRRDDPPAILTNAQTCGYTSGAWSSAVTCGPQQSCTYYTTPYSAPNFGCCSEGAGCGYVSTCLDYKAKGNPNQYGGVWVSDSKFLCGSEWPYCSTLLLYGTTYAPGSSYSFFSYGCQKKTAPPVIAFQTTLQDRALATSSTSSSSSTPPSSSSSTPPSSSPSTSTKVDSVSSTISETGPAITSFPPTNSPTASSSAASYSGLTQGSQIGIGIGVSIGVGILLAAFALWFWHHRKAKNVARNWPGQPPQSFTGHYPEADYLGKPEHLLDYRSSSFRTKSSGKSGYNTSAPYELASTSRPHELAGNNL